MKALCRTNAIRLVPWLCIGAVPFIAHAEAVACSLLTAAQVSAAVGTSVSAGMHVTPTFLETCTWTPAAGSNIRAVTVNLQGATLYDGAKRRAGAVTDMTAGTAVKPAAVGDDGFYTVEGPLVTLLFKKGVTAVKVAVYAKADVDALEAMELRLAKQVAARL